MTRKLVIINPGHDTAGAGYALMQAFNQTPDWRARAICRTKTYLRYPTDIVWSPRNSAAMLPVVTDLMQKADVVHSMNSPRPLGWFTFRPDQTLVVHHLGSTYRREPEVVSAICRDYGAIEVTDSIDLLFDHVRWLPIPADLDGLARLRTAHYRPSSTIRIAHAPTDRKFKDTELIEAAVASLSRKYPISFDLIERVPNRICLVRKARADIFVDQLRYGFGVNAIECWGMGIPVVSGMTDKTALLRGLGMWGTLPWVNADPDSLEHAIESLLVSESWRSEVGQVGRQHADRWHSRAAVVDMASAIYGVQDELQPQSLLGQAG